MTVTEARNRAKKLLAAADVADKAGQPHIDPSLVASLQAEDDQARADLQSAIDATDPS